MSHAYHLAALKLESDLELPELMPWDGPDDAPADLIIRLGKLPPRLDMPDHVAPVFQTKGRSEYLLALPGTGRILVQDGRKVTVDPDPEADPTDTGAFLTGTIQAVLWHQRGLLPLHACAVAIDGRAVALAGPPAGGKSTLAAVLSAKGYQVLADDICIVDVRDGADIKVLPISPQLRLWCDALDHLGIPTGGLRRALSSKEQFLLDRRAGGAREPRTLAAVVVLLRQLTGALSIERLHGALAVGALRDVVHTPRPARALGRDPAIFAALTRLAAGNVSVWRLRVRDDLGCLDEAAALALTALEARP
jgi:hypothetical protein